MPLCFKCQSDRVVYVKQSHFVLLFAIHLIYFSVFRFLLAIRMRTIIHMALALYMHYSIVPMITLAPSVCSSDRAWPISHLIFIDLNSIAYFVYESWAIQHWAPKASKKSIGYFSCDLLRVQIHQYADYEWVIICGVHTEWFWCRREVWAMMKRPWTIFTHRLIDKYWIVFRHDDYGSICAQKAHSEFDTCFANHYEACVSCTCMCEDANFEAVNCREGEPDAKLLLSKYIECKQKKMRIHWSER